MSISKLTAEQAIGKLREAEVAIATSRTVPQACKQIGVSEHTYYRWRSYYRWRKEYGGLRTD